MSYFMWNNNQVAYQFDPGEVGSEVVDRVVKRKNPVAHRIVEKNRRDRLNSQLQVLKSLLPLRSQKVLIRDMISQSRDKQFSTQTKVKSKVGKQEVIEIAAQYIKRLKRELVNDGSAETAATAVATTTVSSGEELYKKGLHDGFDAIMQFAKRYNEVDFQIKAKMLEHANTFKHFVLEQKQLTEGRALAKEQDDVASKSSSADSVSEFEYGGSSGSNQSATSLSPIHEKQSKCARKYKSDLISTFLEYERKVSDQKTFNL